MEGKSSDTLEVHLLSVFLAVITDFMLYEEHIMIFKKHTHSVFQSEDKRKVNRGAVITGITIFRS